MVVDQTVQLVPGQSSVIPFQPIQGASSDLKRDVTLLVDAVPGADVFICDSDNLEAYRSNNWPSFRYYLGGTGLVDYNKSLRLANIRYHMIIVCNNVHGGLVRVKVTASK